MKNKRDALLKELKLRNLDRIAQRVVDDYNKSKYVRWSFKRNEHGWYDFIGLFSRYVIYNNDKVVESVEYHISSIFPYQNFRVIVGSEF